LKKGDVLVLNDTRVFPARLIGRRKDTGGKVEVFLLRRSKTPLDAARDMKDLRPIKSEIWEVLIGNRRKKIGQIIEFGSNLSCEIIKRVDQSVWLVQFNKSGLAFDRLVDKLGLVPTPPYVKSRIANPVSRIPDEKSLREQYQTVYARYRGSVAAPTAGFHFTKELLDKIKKQGVQIEYATLHVGLGTFQPVKSPDLTKHKMHEEWIGLDKNTAQRLNQAKKEDRRVIAVGTTTVRILESFAASKSKLNAGDKWTNIFIYPGYRFKFVDALITNFHLPNSTLLMLAAAFAGRKKILAAYQQAVRKKYRFYSFGDAMLLIPRSQSNG
jgi:S-adenosylmethionine:tRNA ribosyltransferase-isomerase